MRLEDVGPQRNLPDSAEPWGRYTDQKIRELQRQVQRLTGETKGVRQVVASAADSADALVTDAKDTADQAQETGDIAYEAAANAAQEAVNAKETADIAIEDAAEAFREANAARIAAAEAWKQAANQTPNWSFEEGAVRWASNFGFNDTNISEVSDAVDGRYVARVTLGNSVRHELRTANDDAHRVEPERIWDVVVRARVTSGSVTVGVGAYVFNKSNSGFDYLIPKTESLIPADGWVTLRARIETSDVSHEFIAPLITAQNVVGNVVEFDAVEFKDVTDAALAQTLADAAAFQAAAALQAANNAQDAADAAMDVATDAQSAADIALDQARARIRAGGNIIVNGDFEDGDIGWTFSTGQSVVEMPGARSGTHVLSAANLSGGRTVSEWYPANPNAVVEMSFSAYLTPTATTGTVSGLVEVLREGGLIDTIAVSDPEGAIPAATTAKSAWVSRTNEFLLPSDAVKVRAAISATTNGPAYVDDVLAYDVTSAVDARIVGESALLGIDSAVIELTESFSSEVSQTSEQILSTVSDIYSAKTEMIEEIGLIQSQIDQQAENIDFRFIEVSESVIDLEGELQGYQSELATYIRFNNEGIELGKVNNPFITRLSNTELAFYEAGQKVAHISNNQLNITNATINNNLAMGTGGNGYFDWIPRENGNLSFKFRED